MWTADTWNPTFLSAAKRREWSGRPRASRCWRERCFAVGGRPHHIEGSEREPFSETLKLRLLHMILSHHGEYEFGSPKLPMTLEAIARMKPVRESTITTADAGSSS